MKMIDGTIVECNTALGGRRANTARHYQLAGNHGFTAIAKAVTDYCGDHILYINVMNRLSVDCDCMPDPREPEMADIGILASIDPVALDQACVDLVYAAPDGKALIQRIESLNVQHTLDYGQKIGLGSKNYTLVKIDK